MENEEIYIDVQEKEPEAHRTGASGTWRNSFLRAPFNRDAAVRRGIIWDTFETSITWDHSLDFIESINKEITSRALSSL